MIPWLPRKASLVCACLRIDPEVVTIIWGAEEAGGQGGRTLFHPIDRILWVLSSSIFLIKQFKDIKDLTAKCFQIQTVCFSSFCV